MYIDLNVYYGRPTKENTRLEKEIACYDALDALGILYERADHEMANTMEQCLEIQTVLGVNICKNLFLCNRQKTQFYLLLLHGDKVFKTKDLSKQLGVSRLSFGTGEDLERLLHITAGSVSVLGLMHDTDCAVQLVVDSSVGGGDYIGCHPCINTSTLKIAMGDLMEKFLPKINHAPIFVDLPVEEV